jgi:uridine phosphorylase
MLAERWSAFIGGGAICSEMEASAIFIIAAIQRVRAGGLMVCVGNPDMSEAEVRESMADFSLDPLIDTAVEALRVLIEHDTAAG